MFNWEDMVRGFLESHSSKDNYGFTEFCKFLYNRIKMKESVKLSKTEQNSIMNESNKILAKNLILSSAKDFMKSLTKTCKVRDSQEDILSIQDIIEVFLEMKVNRPDFSKVESRTLLKKIYSDFENINETKSAPFALSHPSSFFESFGYQKYYLKFKQRERKPFKVMVTCEYGIFNKLTNESYLKESSRTFFEIKKSSLPVGINKILQRTTDTIISVKGSSSKKFDKLDCDKEYMMYLYVSSILKKESLLLTQLKFIPNDTTIISKGLNWTPQSNLIIEQDESNTSITSICRNSLKKLEYEEGVDLGFLLNVIKEHKQYNLGDISVDFKREKFKFFSNIRIPNSLKVIVKKPPFEIFLDFPDSTTLYAKFKIELRIKNFLDRKTEYFFSILDS